MPRSRAAWSLILLGLAAGCPDDCADDEVGYYLTESKSWSLSASKLQADPCDHPGSLGHKHDDALLVGTRWCPRIGCTDAGACTASSLAECYESSVTGPGQLDGNCIELTGSGELLWRFDPIPCDEEGLFYPEQIRLHAVDVSEVRGRLVSYLDTMALDYLYSGTGSFPLDAMPPRDATLLKVAADERVHMAVNLWAGERRVAWSGDQVALEVEVLRGEAPIVALDEETPAAVLLQFPAGSEAAVWLVVGATRVSLGRVRGVALDTLKELELVAAYANYPEEKNTRSQIPFAARAVARDGDGDLVYGARAEWEVLAGSFPFSPLHFYTDDANHDYTLLIDLAADGEKKESNWCFPTPASGARSFTGIIAAEVAGLHAEVDLAWTYTVPPDQVGLFRQQHPGPRCEGPGYDEPGACNCDTINQSGPALAFLTLLALGTARRRRRREAIPR